jgi:asparagine synthase (glutamine-hydrolysing)
MSVFIEENQIWRKIQDNDANMWVAADKKTAKSIRGFLVQDSSHDGIVKFMRGLTDFFSFAFEDDTQIIIATDHLRSYPLFYYQGNISNSAAFLKNKFDLKVTDRTSLAEFVMSGYVTGPYSLFTDIKVLQPGEMLIYNKKTQAYSLTKYHRYTPNQDNQKPFDDNIDALDTLLDNITQKIIARAGGKPIYIPLSAGLDSRIILCKLHQHGYKNIHCFTYGPKYNFEAKYAQKIAKALGYKWQLITPSNKWIRQEFLSKRRQDFWQYASAYKAIPSMREYSALTYMHDHKMIEDDAIFINGQSGDFISGGHVSPRLAAADMDAEAFTELVINTHYGLWPQMRCVDDQGEISQRIKDVAANAHPSYSYAAEETWEYEARQATLVVNGQRIYEYLGYKWELPLWEKALVDFFEGIPLKDKVNQRLYKAYLKKYNYMGLFPAQEPTIWRWPANMLWVLGAAKALHIFKGPAAKAEFYAYMKYYGHYANQYNQLDIKDHKRTYKNVRNVMSLYVREWAKENPDLVPRDIQQGLHLS